MNPVPHLSRRRRGASVRAFPLIELLTVIAIIGILAAILIPVVGRVRTSARESTCRSNLRQFQLANMLHAADHKGYYITQKTDDGWWITQELFIRYINAGQKPGNQGKKGVVEELKCPTDALTKRKSSDYERLQFPGYGYHKFFDAGDAKLHQNQVRNPSQLFAFADALDFWMNKVPPANDYDWKDEKRHAVTISYRHRNGSNVVYFDGHTGYLRRDQMEPQSNYPQLWKLTP